METEPFSYNKSRENTQHLAEQNSKQRGFGKRQEVPSIFTILMQTTLRWTEHVARMSDEMLH
ncbi:hypothetical protein DPMN_087179 [Dreissena polymorpha]|uniref:Uncharacterized protein n=1 Tax=Dreissena polymorpha TaxID=45954 RepID=A0A9D4KRS5_DREPO|nr:hypothetical protein DPMN_087179 [Dreissena polymorpha]